MRLSESITANHLREAFEPTIDRFFNRNPFIVQTLDDESCALLSISCPEREWIKYRLRDRSIDGPNWQPTPLTDWAYKHEDDIFVKGSAVEESKYWLDPRFPIENHFAAQDVRFIVNPFDSLPFAEPSSTNLENWFRQWSHIVQLPLCPYPGFYSLHGIPGLTRGVFDETKKLLAQGGIQYLTSVPTWYHIAKLNEHLGFEYVHKEDEERIAELDCRLAQHDAQSRKFASWQVMLQFWADLADQNGLVPEDLAGDLILRNAQNNIITYPLTPDRNLWQAIKI